MEQTNLEFVLSITNPVNKNDYSIAYDILVKDEKSKIDDEIFELMMLSQDMERFKLSLEVNMLFKRKLIEYSERLGISIFIEVPDLQIRKINDMLSILSVISYTDIAKEYVLTVDADSFSIDNLAYISGMDISPFYDFVSNYDKYNANLYEYHNSMSVRIVDIDEEEYNVTK